MQLTLKDNTANQYTDSDVNGCEEELFYLSSKTIAELKNEKGINLLIFPHSFYECADEVGKQRLFTLDCSYRDNKPAIDIIRTGNIMGFVGFNNIEISITSRFASGENGDFFLQYMLQKVMYINLFNLKCGMNHSKDAFELLVFMFPEFLKRAMKKGVYRQYVRHTYNDSNVRGPIDTTRHLRCNVPFNYRIAYSAREFDANNSMMQLIRHTIEYISRKQFGRQILRSDRNVYESVRHIIDLTPTYNIRHREQVLRENLRQVNHPYFTEYAALQKLCLQILRHDKVRYEESKNKMYGILFDGAWLWEEYLNTFLCPLLKHPRNKTKEGGMMLYKSFSRKYYPDFYSNYIVLDAKYKDYKEWKTVKNRDVFQIIAYMHLNKLSKGGFIVPRIKSKNIETRVLNNKDSVDERIYLFGMEVDSNAKIYKEYCENMAKQEEELYWQIKQTLS